MPLEQKKAETRETDSKKVETFQGKTVIAKENENNIIFFNRLYYNIYGRKYRAYYTYEL